MRTDTLVGLNAWAKKKIRGARRETIRHIPGVYKPWVGALRRYTLADGAVFEEYIQCEPWAGGPNYHLALKTPDGEVVPESLWKDDDLVW
jgi:hypothetical protein